MRFTAALALLMVASVCRADPPKVPGPIRAAVGEDVQVEVTYDPAKGLAYFAGFDVKHCLFFRGYEEPGTGRATFLLRPKVAGEFRVGFITVGEKQFSSLVLVAGGVAPPDPKPPDPKPPDPKPPEPGVRHVLLIRETAESTPAMRQLIVALRTGAHAEYLKSKNHTFTVWDDDAVGPDGKPHAALQMWKPHYQGLKLPVLLILDSAGNAYRAAEVLPTATADDVIEAVKKAGG